jgi:hypothetical protein
MEKQVDKMIVGHNDFFDNDSARKSFCQLLFFAP